ncbi:helix-turn-helix domain-containing protein [Tahibacter harae]|uniref:Helix-turn-helix domain-containing protein n=1 Tax=Tahibacter harae TaxID=2963937 RepID=A0ABT1QP74_9GAMM|nr:helix-turn-helix transcriptional regulator [Tahibacter harae]MCQ4164082.1 helix-turn-helix domain-containing protein [Tahibacter harae]
MGTRTQDSVSEDLASECFARLLEERSRLDLTQQQVAEFAGRSAKTVGRWEQYIPAPLDAIAALVRQGFDVQYICSGVRSANLRDVRSWVHEDGALYRVPPASTPDEIEMLDSYRKLDTNQRAQARAVLAALQQAPAAVRGKGAAAKKTGGKSAAKPKPRPKKT